jgi:2-dehydropantoate 2-reductase
MKVCVIGAGAIGGWIAGLLAEKGVDVSLLARGETLARLNAGGLRIRRKGQETAYPISASNDPAQLGKPDYVIVAVKGQNLPELAPAISLMLDANTVVVPAINGIPWWFFQGANVPLSGVALKSVDPHGALSAMIVPSRVIGCVVHASAWVPEPGVIEVQGEDRLLFGEPDGSASKRCQSLADAIPPEHVKPVVSDNIRRDIWTKLWGNMTMNPLSVLTGGTTADILDDAQARALVRAMMLEMKAMGAAIGLPLAMTPEQRMDVTRKLGPIKTSMLRDAEAGRALEIDPILGVLVEIADRLNEPAPFIRAVLGLLRVRARVMEQAPH